jgi:hypothetical protein
MKLFISILFLIPTILFAEPKYLCNKIKGQVFEISSNVEIKDFGVDTFVIDINDKEVIFKPSLGGAYQSIVNYFLRVNNEFAWKATSQNNQYEDNPFGEIIILYDKIDNIFTFNLLGTDNSYILIASCRNI